MLGHRGTGRRGDDGGRVVATGTPEQVAEVAESYTGQYLRMYFDGSQPARKRA